MMSSSSHSYPASSSRDGSESSTGQYIQAACVLAWAVRLGSFLFTRVLAAGEDKRFRKIKQSKTRFFIVWLIQVSAQIDSLCYDDRLYYWDVESAGGKTLSNHFIPIGSLGLSDSPALTYCHYN